MWEIQQQQWSSLAHSCLDILYSALKGQKLSRVSSTFLTVSLPVLLVVQAESHTSSSFLSLLPNLSDSDSGPGTKRNANEVKESSYLDTSTTCCRQLVPLPFPRHCSPNQGYKSSKVLYSSPHTQLVQANSPPRQERVQQLIRHYEGCRDSRTKL